MMNADFGLCTSDCSDFVLQYLHQLDIMRTIPAKMRQNETFLQRSGIASFMVSAYNALSRQVHSLLGRLLKPVPYLSTEQCILSLAISYENRIIPRY